jgi:hypothetical protein
MNLNYHIHEISIKCPYCDKDCEDDDCVVAQELEARMEFECYHCNKKFFAEASIVYSTYSDCRLNDEKCDLKQSAFHPAVFSCEKCQHYEVWHIG